jgi:hypothetical protein
VCAGAHLAQLKVASASSFRYLLEFEARFDAMQAAYGRRDRGTVDAHLKQT